MKCQKVLTLGEMLWTWSICFAPYDERKTSENGKSNRDDGIDNDNGKMNEWAKKL